MVAIRTSRGGINSFCMCSGNNFSETGTGAGRFFYLTNADGDSATEGARRALTPIAFTLDLFGFDVSVNTKAGDSVFHTRISGSDGNGLITVGAGLTGIFQDVINSDVLVAQDFISARGDLSASGVGSIVLEATMSRGTI